MEPRAYVNASYIKAPVHDSKGKASSAYIAAQGPMPTTVAEFLTMVYEQKSPQIVMLCQYVRFAFFMKKISTDYLPHILISIGLMKAEFQPVFNTGRLQATGFSNLTITNSR